MWFLGSPRILSLMTAIASSGYFSHTAFFRVAFFSLFAIPSYMHSLSAVFLRVSPCTRSFVTAFSFSLFAHSRFEQHSLLRSLRTRSLVAVFAPSRSSRIWYPVLSRHSLPAHVSQSSLGRTCHLLLLAFAFRSLHAHS